jgi:hypothetical protein
VFVPVVEITEEEDLLGLGKPLPESCEFWSGAEVEVVVTICEVC